MYLSSTIANGDHIVNMDKDRVLLLRHDNNTIYYVNQNQIRSNGNLTNNGNGKRREAEKIDKRDLEWMNLCYRSTHEITLICDAQWHLRKYAVCQKNGRLLECAKFDQNIYCGNQFLAELLGAEKAIGIAANIFTFMKNAKIIDKKSTVKLNLISDVKSFSETIKPGHMSYRLIEFARSNGIGLDIKWIEGKNNPADRHARSDKSLIFNENNMPNKNILIEKRSPLVIKSMSMGR